MVWLWGQHQIIINHDPQASSDLHSGRFSHPATFGPSPCSPAFSTAPGETHSSNTSDSRTHSCPYPAWPQPHPAARKGDNPVTTTTTAFLLTRYRSDGRALPWSMSIRLRAGKRTCATQTRVLTATDRYMAAAVALSDVLQSHDKWNRMFNQSSDRRARPQDERAVRSSDDRPDPPVGKWALMARSSLPASWIFISATNELAGHAATLEGHLVCIANAIGCRPVLSYERNMSEWCMCE